MDMETSKTSPEAYCRLKWSILFDYLDESRDGVLAFDEVSAFGNRLIASGKAKLGRRLLACYNTAWSVFCDANKLPRTARSLEREQFIQGMQHLKVTEYFRRVYVPTLARGYFEAIDTNGDGGICLEEWRSFQKLRGNEIESSVQDTFKRLDRDNSGDVSPDEILHAFTQFGLGDNPEEDYSFIYKLQ